MSTTTYQSTARAFPFAVRPLTAEDIDQSAQIEREAFPTLFPPTSFRRELKNRVASYLVACNSAEVGTAEESGAHAAPNGVRGRGLMGAVLENARNLWNDTRIGVQQGHDFVAGFLGIWYMADEAHIVSVGVRADHRGRGIGELLVIAAVEQAMARGADAVSLEVRPSNWVARNLYGKYGFEERGRRKSYYADNREDAIIMTTDSIQRPPYAGFFSSLARKHQRRWGRAERVL